MELATFAIDLVLLILSIFLLRHLSKPQPPKARLAHSVVHVQQRTEEAETLDFAITLFLDESPEQRETRILEVCEIAERRRKYNNDRMQEHFAAAKAAMEAERAAQSRPALKTAE